MDSLKARIFMAAALALALTVFVTVKVTTSVIMPRPSPTPDPYALQAAQQAETIKVLKTLGTPAP